jgi:hypothetical protein
VVEKLRELPGEKVSRKELAEEFICGELAHRSVSHFSI